MMLQKCFQVHQNEQFVDKLVLWSILCISHEEILYFSIRFDIIERPVRMLTASVYVSERLLMKQGSQAMSLKHLFQNLHRDHVLVDGFSSISIH